MRTFKKHFNESKKKEYPDIIIVKLPTGNKEVYQKLPSSIQDYTPIFRYLVYDNRWEQVLPWQKDKVYKYNKIFSWNGVSKWNSKEMSFDEFNKTYKKDIFISML